MPRARKELLNLNLHTTPLGKLSCIRRVVKALSQVQRRRSSADSGVFCPKGARLVHEAVQNQTSREAQC